MWQIIIIKRQKKVNDTLLGKKKKSISILEMALFLALLKQANAMWIFVATIHRRNNKV